MIAKVGWLLTVATAVFAIADTAVVGASYSLFSEETIAVHGWPFVNIATFSCTAIGAMIVSRHPRHRVGWLLCVIGVGSSISVLAEGVSIWMLDSGRGSAEVAHVAAWFSVLLGGQAALVGLAVVFLLAPHGHLTSLWQRLVAWAGVMALALFTAGLISMPPATFTLDGDAYRGRPVAALLTDTGFLLMAVVVVASVGSMIVRLRGAEGELAAQLRWFAASAASIGIGLTWLILVEAVNGGEQSWLAALPLMASYVFVSVGIGMAVLRYRLYDIDVVINRAVVVTCGTAFAAGAYALVVVAAGEVAGARSDSIWPSFVTLVVVALAFQPLRQRVTRLSDRVAYGSRAAPYEALADFSRRLSGALPGPSALLPVVAEAARTAVSAKSATARLIVANAPDMTARRPDGGDVPAAPGGSTEIPVMNRGETLGAITVELPQGRSLRAADHQLLVDLANQTSMAFRNTQLTAELVARVDLVGRRTVELSQSRTRIIKARDAERARIEHAIRRDVMPHLERVPVELTALRGHIGDPGAAKTVHALADATRTALDDLRAISRGVFPTQLARSGLGPAIAALLGRSTRAGLITISPSARGRRFDRRVEAAAYFCAVEAIPELQPPIEATMAADLGRLKLEFSGASTADVVATQGMHDRMAPLAGTAEWTVGQGRIKLSIEIPISPENNGELAEGLGVQVLNSPRRVDGEEKHTVATAPDGQRGGRP